MPGQLSRWLWPAGSRSLQRLRCPVRPAHPGAAVRAAGPYRRADPGLHHTTTYGALQAAYLCTQTRPSCALPSAGWACPQSALTIRQPACSDARYQSCPLLGSPAGCDIHVRAQVTFSRDGSFLYTGARSDPAIMCWDVRQTSQARPWPGAALRSQQALLSASCGASCSSQR